MSLSDLIKRVPKAELHVHIEGTMEPDLLFSLSQRNSIQLSYTLSECRVRRQSYIDLQDFLGLYYDACKVLINEEDFYELALAYLKKAIIEGVTHAEIFFDPQTHLNRNISFSTFFEGFWRATQEVKQSIHVQWIMCFLRDLSQEEAIKVIYLAEPYKEKIKGVGLDSNEIGNPGKKFANAFQLAGDIGLCGADCSLKVAHAGEEGDASGVIETLFYLKPRRIDHGVMAIEDVYLCQFLKENKIGLTCCPLSNKSLTVESRFFGNRKVVKELFELGVMVTINSDDPAFFGGYICENIEYVLRDFEEGERKEVLRKLCKNSFLVSFISEEMREIEIRKIDEVLDS